jgi:hypothetical protein
VADGWCWFVLREEYCWLVAGGWFVLREKYCWLVADKPSEQGHIQQNHRLHDNLMIYLDNDFILQGTESHAAIMTKSDHN